jgi:hypothetical protein
MRATGVVPSPSRFSALVAPDPSAQGKVRAPNAMIPWRWFPGRGRTITGRGAAKLAFAALRSRFFEYDRRKEQFAVIVFSAEVVPHKRTSVKRHAFLNKWIEV